MARDLVCFRIPLEARAAVEEAVRQQGITISEWYRAITLAALGQGVGVSEGYVQGRAMGYQAARIALSQAAGMLPSTFEEAAARFGLPGSEMVGGDG